MTEIIIVGWRAGGEDRREAESAPEWQLFQLSEEQRTVAKRMGVPEDDYKKIVYAGKRSQQRLIEKAKVFATFLEGALSRLAPGAYVDKLRLLTLEREYRVDIYIAGKKVLFRVSEDMVEDFMEKGFAEVGQRIEQNLETVLGAQAGHAKHGS